MGVLESVLVAVACCGMAYLAFRRLQLSAAKHPSLTGHAKIAKRLARWVPYYGVDENELCDYDGAPADIAGRRRKGLDNLSASLLQDAEESISFARRIQPGIADMQFTKRYRVPFLFAQAVMSKLQLPALVQASSGVKTQDLDGRWRYDLTGSYGVNVFGYDFYKACMAAAEEKVHALGPVLGSYHPCIARNVERLRRISKLDQVSFHMSGTEAVMQAVRLARYHTGKSHVVKFSGAYHGWWDGVQPGIGNPGRGGDVYTLSEMSERTLTVLKTRNDIACVLINPIQIMHPNKNAPGDSMLLGQRLAAKVSREAYGLWLQALRKVCNEKGIVFILDEVFVGFRLAYGGAQEYFGVQADMVTYGKTLGGGLPIGVLCGHESLMKRYRDQHPADICFARGTFNSHPLVMAAMDEFLTRIESDDVQSQYRQLDMIWDQRFERLNQALAEANVPVQVENFVSIGMICFQSSSLYNWMYQFYLADAGLSLSWVGSGRLIFSHNFTDTEFDEVIQGMVQSANQMQADGWWWQSDQPWKLKLKQARAFARALVHNAA